MRENKTGLIILIAAVTAAVLVLWQKPDFSLRASLLEKPAAADSTYSAATDPMGEENNYYPCLTPARADTLTFGDYNIYFGDMHYHSYSNQINYTNVWYAFNNAKNVLEYDFFALTDHAHLMTDAAWNYHIAIADAWNQPGEFVTFLAYEWRSDTYGHENVIFRDGGTDSPRYLFTDPATDTPAELYTALASSGKTFMANINHPRAGTRWDLFNATYNHLAEMYQRDGSHESELIAELNDGLVLGFLGNSDRHYLISEGFVTTGVLAEELTRESIFSALENRRTFATTRPVINLIFSHGDDLQGNVDESTYATIPLRIQATSTESPINKVEIVKNGSAITNVDPNAYSYDDTYDEANGNSKAYYYARITLDDGTKAWSSPLFFGY